MALTSLQVSDKNLLSLCTLFLSPSNQADQLKGPAAQFWQEVNTEHFCGVL